MAQELGHESEVRQLDSAFRVGADSSADELQFGGLKGLSQDVEVRVIEARLEQRAAPEELQHL